MKQEKLSVIVVGGGPAGFFAAIRAAELNPDADITLFEMAPQVLQKVKISGGGRCNVTNVITEPKELVKHYPRGDKALLGPFHRFSSADTVAWFESHGVKLKTEEDGRIFPVSDNSQTIIDCLAGEARSRGVKIRTQALIENIIPPPRPGLDWKVVVKGKIYEGKGQAFSARKLLLTPGSSYRMWDMLRDMGHAVVKGVPSLFTFNITDRLLFGLEGVSVQHAIVSVPETELKETGPVLITHWGMSGPAVLRLSAWGARIFKERRYKFTLNVNWSGKETQSEFEEAIWEFARANPRRIIIAQPAFHIPGRLWERFVHEAGIPEKPWADLSKADVERLAQTVFACKFQVMGKSMFKDEFVTAGGIELDEVDFRTMESKKLPGLYFAGEVLDIDAITGGFNFQAAWTTGWIAGEGMAGEREKK